MGDSREHEARTHKQCGPGMCNKVGGGNTTARTDRVRYERDSGEMGECECGFGGNEISDRRIPGFKKNKNKPERARCKGVLSNEAEARRHTAGVIVQLRPTLGNRKGGFDGICWRSAGGSERQNGLRVGRYRRRLAWFGASSGASIAFGASGASGSAVSSRGEGR